MDTFHFLNWSDSFLLAFLTPYSRVERERSGVGWGWVVRTLRSTTSCCKLGERGTGTMRDGRVIVNSQRRPPSQGSLCNRAERALQICELWAEEKYSRRKLQLRWRASGRSLAYLKSGREAKVSGAEKRENSRKWDDSGNEGARKSKAWWAIEGFGFYLEWDESHWELTWFDVRFHRILCLGGEDRL